MVTARDLERADVRAVSVPGQAELAHAKICAAVRAIPFGRTASYGEVALRAGLPGRARLVARVLASGSEQLPWHRVLRADGRLGFAVGSAGAALQAELLAAEGVQISKSAKLSKSRQPRSLDAQLFAPED